MASNPKRLALILCFFCTVLVHGQNIGRINFTEIKKSIENSQGEYYYPSLVERILKNDTTLVYAHYKHLYYGSVFQENYYPYGMSNAKKEFNNTYHSGDYKKTIIQGKSVLSENPVDIEVTLKMIISFLELGDTAQAKVYGKNYFGFLDVIYSSGDGKTVETAYVVVSVDDEYRVVGDLGLKVKNQELINDCDLLVIKKLGQRKAPWNKVKELYFNVQIPLMSLSKTFKDVDLPPPDEDPDEEEDE